MAGRGKIPPRSTGSQTPLWKPLLEAKTAYERAGPGNGIYQHTRYYLIRVHDLRHTFATLALQNGVDIKTVSGMLGHYSAGFTLDTYTHVTTPAQIEAANTMGNVLAVGL